MNPYTVPASSSQDHGRAHPAFQALGLMTRRQMNLLVYLGAVIAAGVGYYQFRLLSALHGPLPLGILWPFVLMLAPLLMMLANERRRKELRQHPLARSGEALAGGLVNPDRWRWSAKEQDCLFLTRTELVLFPFSQGRVEERLSLAEIERLEEVREFAARQGFDAYLRDGSTRRFEVYDAKRWIRTIEEARRGAGGILPA